MTIRFGIDYYDLRAYYRDFVKTTPSMVWRRWLLAILLPVVLFADPLSSILSGTPYNVDAVFFYMLAAISAVWVAVVFILYRNMPSRLARKVIANPQNVGVVGYREMTFSDDGICVKREDSESQMSWSAIVKAKDIGTHFLLYVAATQAFMVPKHKMNRSDVETLESLLKMHDLLNNKNKKLKNNGKFLFR